MTKVNLIDKRKKALQQKKEKLKQVEASLNAQARKNRTRKLIEIGGLAAKAGLEDWSSNSLLGAFLFLKEHESEKELMDDWAYKGGASFSQEKVKKSPVIVKFESSPNEDVRTALKEAGLKWNSLRKEWEGYVNISDLKNLTAPYNASIQQLSISSEG